jgi:hypothetical protein
MSQKNIALIAVASAVLVLFIGVRAIYGYIQERVEEHRRQEQIDKAQEAVKQLQQQLGAYAQVQQGLANMPNLANVNPGMYSGNLSPAAQTAMIQLVQKYQISMGVAAFLAQAKAQVLSQSNNSVRYSLTLPDGITSETTITLTPNQEYSPTPAEIALAQRTGVQTYRVQFSAKTESETKARITLRYFIPNSAIPANLQQRFQDKTTSFFQLIPSAYAGDSSLGMDVVSDTGVEVTKEVLKQTAEHGKLSKEFPTPLSRLMDVLNAFKKESEHLDWMDQLDFLDYCANNPSNPLTQKAYQQDPNYQKQTLQGLQDARSDVMQMTAMRFLNLETSVATDLVEGPMGAMTTPISSYNDGTLKNLADDRVNEAKKTMPDCKPAEHYNPGQYQPMQGNLKYDYNLTSHVCKIGCVDYEEQRKMEGSVHLVADSFGYLAGKGNGQMEVTKKRHAYDQYCKQSDGNDELSGSVEIKVEAGGETPQNGVIKVNIGGDSLAREGKTIGCDGKVQNLNGTAAAGASCEFHNVDLVHGGSYSTYEMGDPHGTCKLELFPQ